MIRLLGIAGLLLWLGGTAVAWHFMNRGVIAEPVNLTVADTPIHGTLLRPRSAERDLPIAVLLHGAASSHRSCLPGLALPLARRGYLVLAIDLQGHGASGGSIPRTEFAALTATPSIRADHPEVDAALDFVKKHPLFIGQHPCGFFHCIGLVGHSRGGWIAANVGYRRPDVDGVITIGSAPLVCDASRPRNLLIVTSRQERLCSLDHGSQALARATGAAVIGPESLYGNFWKGDARRLVRVNNADHITQLANPTITNRVVEWLDTSLHMDPGWKRTDRDVTPILVAVLLALTGGLLGAGLLARASARKILPAAAEGQPAASGLRLVVLGVFLVLMVPLAAALAVRVEAGPIYNAGPTLLLAVLLGLACWAAGIWRRPACPEGLHDWPATCRGVALGALGLTTGVLWFGLPLGLTWLTLLPSTPRLGLALVFFPLLLAPSLVLAAGATALLAGRNVWIRGGGCLAVPGILWSANHLLVEAHYPLFLVPIGLIAGSLLMAWPVWVLAARPGLMAARTVSLAGSLAWLAACHLPFVH